MAKIKVAILDYHPVVLIGIEVIVSKYKDLISVGVYEHSDELIEGLDAKSPDILLAEIDVEGLQGEKIVRLLKKRYSKTKLIVFTASTNIFHAKMMMREGAAAYLLKTTSEEDIVKAIRAVYRGEQVIDPHIKELIFQKALMNKKQVSELPKLTPREKEILRLLASNYNSKEISEKLFISQKTVENHRSNMLEKFKVKNAASLIKQAIELDMLE